HEGELAELKQQLELLKQQVALLEKKIDADHVAGLAEPTAPASADPPAVATEENNAAAVKAAEAVAPEAVAADGIQLGGAVRTNYSYTSYNDGSRNRGGDFAFDIFRLDLKGSIGDVSLNAEI